MTEQELKLKKKEWNERYREKHKDQIRERGRIWYSENKALADQRVKDCQKKYPDRVKARGILWRNKNKHVIHARYLRHRSEVIRKGIAASKKRRKSDVSYRLLGNLRHRVWMALRGHVKSDRTLNLIGCSVEKLKRHLEAKFASGMSWENYGYRGWHVDHIKPCASFDLKDTRQQSECFHYLNLQPLWAEDNFKKHAFDRDYVKFQ
jgi:hypothetical protein